MPTRPVTLGRIAPKPAGRRDRRVLNRKPWKTLRRRILREHPFCATCGVALGADGQVDHITPRAVRPDLQLTRSNCQALCARCHAVKTNKERRL